MAQEKATKRIAYVGDPNEINSETELGSGPEILTWNGKRFKKGEFREVPFDLVVKARKHSHFVVEGEEKATDEEAEEEVEKEPREYSAKELREILDARKVEYAGNASTKVLLGLVKESGGLPE